MGNIDRYGLARTRWHFYFWPKHLDYPNLYKQTSETRIGLNRVIQVYTNNNRWEDRYWV